MNAPRTIHYYRAHRLRKSTHRERRWGVIAVHSTYGTKDDLVSEAPMALTLNAMNNLTPPSAFQ